MRRCTSKPVCAGWGQGFFDDLPKAAKEIPGRCKCSLHVHERPLTESGADVDIEVSQPFAFNPWGNQQARFPTVWSFTAGGWHGSRAFARRTRPESARCCLSVRLRQVGRG